MTQIERLEQAKTWLEQLSQGRDPVTGEALPDDCVAYMSGTNRRLFGCAVIIKHIIAEDGPEPDPNRTNNFKNQLNRAMSYLWMVERLSRGYDLRAFAKPLPPRDPLGRQELRELFSFVAQVLNNSLLAGYFTAKGSFALPQGTVLPISQTPVELAGLLEKINALRDADAVRALTPETLEPYLASQGMLAVAPQKEYRKAYVPTPAGEAQGITCPRPGGRRYAAPVFSPRGQQYVAEHLDDIAAYLADPSRWEPSREGLPPRQIDKLKQTRDHLDRLSRGTDPLTGDPLGPSVAGEESVRRLLASCAQDLSYMILHDEPQLLPDGSVRGRFKFSLSDCESDPNIKSRDALVLSILGMERLARGCHPDTGAGLEPEDPLAQEGLRECFAFVARCLRNTYLANQYTAKEPFTLSKEAQSKIYVSEKPVTAATLVGRINIQREDSTAVLGISADGLFGFLESEHLVGRDDTPYRGVKLTPRSEALGIRLQRFEPAGRAPYTAPAFDANAQQYIVDHLDDMIRLRNKSNQKRKEYLVEQLDKLKASSRKPPAQTPAVRKSKEAEPVRHVEILKHAYTYLDQLTNYVDPIIRTSLPDVSAGRSDSVHKLIALCRGDLKKMLDFDDPARDGAGRDPRYIDQQDRVLLNTRIRGLELLSQGCYPGSKAPLDPRDPLYGKELRRCFAFVAQCLRNTLDAGYYTAKVPFALSPEARSRVPISPEPISLPQLLKTISAQREDDTGMRGLHIETVAEYLFSQGLLTRFLDGEMTHTPKGEAQGFVCTKLLRADDPFYGDVLCAPAAQQYVVDHLDEIAAARWTQVDPAVAGQPIPQDVDDRIQPLGDAFRRAGGPEERQADALVRAKNYLEQLRDYTDPLTGEYLTGDQTVRNAGVNRLFFSCAQALEKMIAYDSGAKKSASLLKDLAFWQHSAQGMERLARGCHPDTGAALEPEDPLTQEGLRECFAFVARCLYRGLHNGSFSARAPFSLPPEARPDGPFSEKPIGMIDLLKAINARREDETAVRPLSSKTLLGYLASQGLLTESPGRQGKKKHDLSPRSEEMGITQTEETRDGIPYMKIVYGPAAQQYVIDHLDDVIAFQAEP